MWLLFLGEWLISGKSLDFPTDPGTINKTNRVFLQQKEGFLQQYLPVLRHTQLFTGISDEKIAAMLGCLQAQKRVYQKAE